MRKFVWKSRLPVVPYSRGIHGRAHLPLSCILRERSNHMLSMYLWKWIGGCISMRNHCDSQRVRLFHNTTSTSKLGFYNKKYEQRPSYDYSLRIPVQTIQDKADNKNYGNNADNDIFRISQESEINQILEEIGILLHFPKRAKCYTYCTTALNLQNSMCCLQHNHSLLSPYWIHTLQHQCDAA